MFVQKTLSNCFIFKNLIGCERLFIFFCNQNVHTLKSLSPQLLHGPGVAQAGLLLPGEDLNGKAGAPLDLRHCLGGVSDVSQGGRGKHRHLGDVQGTPIARKNPSIAKS